MIADIMTPEQVAAFLQLSPDTVYRLIRSHKLAAAKIGRSYRIPRDDLELFIASNSNRLEVRKSLFKRVEDIGKRNSRLFPQLTSDEILEELEQLDREKSRSKNDPGSN